MSELAEIIKKLDSKTSGEIDIDEIERYTEKGIVFYRIKFVVDDREYGASVAVPHELSRDSPAIAVDYVSTYFYMQYTKARKTEVAAND